MDTNVYKRLAEKLDAVPNGFPQTIKGLKLLAKMFTPKEAAIASKMRLTLENAETIARRLGKNQATIENKLAEMVQKGLIRSRQIEGEWRFGLMPFVVGVYEAQLSRLDKEMAQLFEEYYKDFAEGVLDKSPSLHRVIPINKSIPVEIQVFPYEQISTLLQKAKSFGVRKCICRVQKAMISEQCQHKTENCIVFASVEGAFENSPDIRVITKNEALKILQESEEAGLIHSTTNVQEGHSYICNCCTCCCGIIRGLSQFSIPNSVAKSDFFADIDPKLCIGCGRCIERCHFGAPSLEDKISQVDQKRCVGCGLCVVTCPSKAMTLLRKPENQKLLTPRNRDEWRKERAKNRGISLQQVL